MKIKNQNGEVLYRSKDRTIKATLEAAIKSNINLAGAILFEAKLKGADLRGADLRKTDLAGSNLRGANLRGSNLRGATLRGSDLWDANLEGSDLRGATLGESDLWAANLRGSDLRGSDLRGANLRGSDLGESDLRGSDLRGANLDYAGFQLRCTWFDIKVDIRLIAQLAYHICRLDWDDPGFEDLKQSLKPFANEFHRVKSGEFDPVE